MKKSIFLMLALLTLAFAPLSAADASSLKWGKVCSGGMDASWYGSAEAIAIANKVLQMQRVNGGWIKNIEMHTMSDEAIAAEVALHNDHSCFDNTATTQEMRFLAKVYQALDDTYATEKANYKEAFQKALDLIFTAEKEFGGWSQYYPETGNGSYRDYITFNDDLTINVMKLLRDIHSNTGDFLNITDEASREASLEAYNRGIETILKCQIDDNGVKSAWCAQHTNDGLYYPAHGRPHELPSISGCESAAILSFLMSIENPSDEIQNAIHSAIQWLNNHKIEGKAIENFTNDNGESDRRIIDKEGSAIWGRFIQLGGETGEKYYNAFFEKLKNGNGKRTYTYNGTAYTYYDYDIAVGSYDATKAYQPIYAIYDNSQAHLFYRFLYNYEDTDPVVDDKGVPVLTSLYAARRTSNQYLGSWPLKTINNEYPAWVERMKNAGLYDDYSSLVLAQSTYTSTTTEGSTNYWNFSNGLSISSPKGYAAGSEDAIKYSRNNTFTINLPKGIAVERMKIEGYDNYADVDGYINNINGADYGATTYVFPKKDAEGNAVWTTHNFDFTSSPIEDKLAFEVKGQQCVFVITLYYTPATQVSVSVGSTGLATFTSVYPINFGTQNDIEAYTASYATNDEDGVKELTFNRVLTAAACEGLLLRSTKSGSDKSVTLSLPVCATAPSPAADNKLVGTLRDITISNADADASTNYVLNNLSTGLGFYWAKLASDGGTKVGAGKAYLQLPETFSSSSSANFHSIVWGDTEGTTAIDDITIDGETNPDGTADHLSSPADNILYNLQGQRVQTPTKGLYILNGKKIVVR